MDKINHLLYDRSLKKMVSRPPAWLWLVLGIIFLPFTFFQTVIPLAAWLAPIFLLRFERTTQRSWGGLALIFLAYAAGFDRHARLCVQ